MKTLGENIRFLRKNKYMSMQKVRDITGISKSTLSELERNMTNPTIDTIKKIAFALEVSVSELLQEKPVLEKEKIDSITQYTTNPMQ